MKDSTSFESRLRFEFSENPVGQRVELPCGSLAVVKAFVDDDYQRLHRVVGITSRGRLCKLPPGTHHWYPAAELKLVYYTASVKPDFL